MMRRLSPLLVSLCASTATARDKDRDSGTVWVTPHESYSSSIGVLGCKVNTNRIAYWPNSVDCNNICVSLTYENRDIYLLRVDRSEGAYDVSYDAWNYLYTGHSATEKPTAGGPVEMQFENVAASKCKDLIHTKGGKLPLSAPNSINFLASCLDQNDTWVGDNYALYNILDPICTIGHDEACELDYPAANQPSCPSTLGLPDLLDDAPVYNIRYPTGEKVRASNGQPADDGATGLGLPSVYGLGLMVVVSRAILCFS